RAPSHSVVLGVHLQPLHGPPVSSRCKSQSGEYPLGQVSFAAIRTPMFSPAGAQVAPAAQAESAQSANPLQSSSRPLKQSSSPMGVHSWPSEEAGSEETDSLFGPDDAVADDAAELVTKLTSRVAPDVWSMGGGSLPPSSSGIDAGAPSGASLLPLWRPPSL